MKNIFGLFGNQSAASNEENVAIDLNEQELEAVNGVGGGDYCYEDDDDEHRHHHHHRHHRHHE